MKKETVIMSRNQNFKSYGRGKHSNHPGTVVNSSIQFDKLFFNNSNKPTASKSAGTIGKWGMTSFTSLRSSSFTVGTKDTSRFSSSAKKRAQPTSVDPGHQTKCSVLNNNIKLENSPIVSNRKFFKSRNSTEHPNQKSYKSSNAAESKKAAKLRTADENKKQKICLYEPPKPVVSASEKPVKQTIKKVAVKIPEEPIELSEKQDADRDKPPIVLRIFKGTSRLVSETSKSDSSDIESQQDDILLADNPGLSPPTESQQENVIPPEEPTLVSPTAPAPAPEPKLAIRSLKRRSPEQSEFAEEPVPPAPVPTKVRRAIERMKSPSPEPVSRTRAVRRRSPEKSKSPEPEPPIVTRSLRRRQPPAEIVAASEPHTSPKRTLRSTKNFAPLAAVGSAPSAPGKIVITNLNSNNPSVYMSEDGAPPQPSPPCKESKEHRSYGNKHKHKAKAEKPEPVPVVAEEPKVEDLLADIVSSSDTIPVVSSDQLIQRTKVPDTSLDEDRAELLHLLEDDEEIAEIEAKVEKVDEVKQENGSRSSSESQLKIKIKIPKPSVEEESAEPSIPNVSSICDLQDVKSEPQLYPASINSVKINDAESLIEDVAVKNSEEKLEEIMSSNESTVANISVPVANVSIKKGSIFKHRGSSDANKKRLALYKHKWVDDKDGANPVDDDKNQNSGLKSKALDAMLDMELDDMPLTKFIRQPAVEKFDFDESPPVTGIKCSKKNKDFYTVVRNVKKAHQIQESGEFQEFNDDVEYILDALQDNNPIGTRCLSAITLATKCTEPAFRMHVRAHGTVTKFFRALHDATKDQSLGLCTATVMFVLSQDRLNMDLDRDSLELMLNLLESDASHTKALEDCGLTDSQLTRTKDKVRQICDDIKAQGHAKDLDLENITVGHLSMETLLSLTSKRAGEWFKEELRELGGLEHIIKTIVECCKHVDDTANAWSSTSLEKIRKVDRCLRVLENVTMLNEENNVYLLEYQDGILINTLVRMFKVCDYEIPLYPTYSITDKESTGAVLREFLIANIKVLINVTHDFQRKANGSSIIGSRPGVIESSLHVLLQVPQYIPKEETFEVMLLTLIMLINLVEHSKSNRKAIIEAKAPSDEESIFETKAKEPAVKALILMFYNYEELARNEEKKTDAILEGENAEKPPTNAPQKVHEDFIEETISQLVQKAGQNMEHTLIAAYVAMLIGYLIIDNEDYEKFVRNYLPEKNFQFMTSVLQKFYSFMTLTASGGTANNRDMKSIQMVIQKLQESDGRLEVDNQLAKNVSSNENLDTNEDKFNESHNVSDVSISAS